MKSRFWLPTLVAAIALLIFKLGGAQTINVTPGSGSPVTVDLPFTINIPVTIVPNIGSPIPVNLSLALTGTPSPSPTATGSATPTATPTAFALTAPADGATVNGVTTITVVAPNPPVTSVVVTIDAATFAISPPLSWSWSTYTYTNGQHRVVAYGYDVFSHIVAQMTANVTVSNTPTPTPSPSPTPVPSATPT